MKRFLRDWLYALMLFMLAIPPAFSQAYEPILQSGKGGTGANNASAPAFSAPYFGSAGILGSYLVNTANNRKVAWFSGNGTNATGIALGLIADTDLPNHSTSLLTSGQLAAARGGLGIDTSGSSAGGIPYLSSTGVWSILSVGANGKVIKVSSGLPAYGDDDNTGGGGGSVLPGTQDGRVTATTNVSRTTSDVTSAGSVYFTPDIGNHISLYESSAWADHTFAQITIPLTGLNTSQPYDIFIYDSDANTTADAADVVAWTNHTTRATAIAFQDGVPVKTGATSRRLVATILLAGSASLDDSTSLRGICNVNNRIPRAIACADTTNSWTYGTASYRAINGGSTIGQHRVRCVTAVADIAADVTVLTLAASAGLGGVGIDSTTVSSSPVRSPSVNTTAGLATYKGNMAVGSHDIYALENAFSGASQTFYGDNNLAYQTGLTGTLLM